MSWTVQHEARGRISKPVPWWLVIAILVVAAAFLFSIALYIGHRLGYAAAEKPIVLVKTCPAPIPVDPFVGRSCAEVATACYSQRRMDRVKKIQG